MNLEAQWIAGFVDGEGCFHVAINANKEMTLGVQVLPEFTVVQHQKDIKVLHALKSFFKCGVVRVNHGDRMAFRVRKKSDLLEKIIPFFMKHQLKTSKRIDFEKFRDVVLMLEKGSHLTKDGVEQIRKIAQQMNRGRTRESPTSIEI